MLSCCCDLAAGEGGEAHVLVCAEQCRLETMPLLRLHMSVDHHAQMSGVTKFPFSHDESNVACISGAQRTLKYSERKAVDELWGNVTTTLASRNSEFYVSAGMLYLDGWDGTGA